ncbi:hypothetical protein M8C21_004585 [Ambrosia artemisiifolia]|uniref:Uncharacterized protein n=1 Tax=Ambrosia artemisiifolia TaxID=4212 RepID=A0AAD5G1Y2_AMBAR|nr:hypothetical protein M8C21_004585 [Ambrosia artemisiifolia]
MATHSFVVRPTMSPATITLNSFKLNRRSLVQVSALNDRSNSGDANININSKGKQKSAVPSSNYVVPLDYASTGITRPLAEIFRDLNKRIPDNIIVKRPDDDDDNGIQSSFIPWYHANRMLSFYAPGEGRNEYEGFRLGHQRVLGAFALSERITLQLGWCGEIRDVIFSDTGCVTVVYRVTVRGSDGEAHREATGTVLAAASGQSIDPVAAAEEIAFCKACARFGLGLYLYHED